VILAGEAFGDQAFQGFQKGRDPASIHTDLPGELDVRRQLTVAILLGGAQKRPRAGEVLAGLLFAFEVDLAGHAAVEAVEVGGAVGPAVGLGGLVHRQPAAARLLLQRIDEILETERLDADVAQLADQRTEPSDNRDYFASTRS